MLITWISGLQMYAVLDGHDRLRAALADAQLPALLSLCAVLDEPWPRDPRAQHPVLRAVSEPPARRGRPAHDTDTVNRVVLDAFDARPHRVRRTRAYALEGGAATWSADVEALGGGRLDDDARAALLR